MSYSEKEVNKMIDMYTSNPCLEMVDKISVALNKTRKSVIAKLVKEGVYISRQYTDKRGELPVTKIALVREIEDTLDTKLPDLDKAPKTTLKELNKMVQDLHTTLDTALDDLRAQEEELKAAREMLIRPIFGKSLL
jgi:hypothetical protein